VTLRTWLRAPFGHSPETWARQGGWRGFAQGILILLFMGGLVATCVWSQAAPPAHGAPADCARSPTLPAANLVGPARVVDGDTLCVVGRSVRLKGIDAPELHARSARTRALARASSRHLAGLTARGPVRCRPVEIDRFDRVVAWCEADGRDLGRAMIAAGHAMRWARYDEGRYAGL
jgi:endonuclease YncB( thermonuclease family)